VHAPEFAFEKDIGNVKKAVADFKITYPVAIDNNYAIWRAFDNMYWPADFLIDAKGLIRAHHFGEGDYVGTEKAIQQLLAERNGAPVSAALVTAPGAGVAAAADFENALSPETYVGYSRAERFASPGGQKHDQTATYKTPDAYGADGWALGGVWKVGAEEATSAAPGAAIQYSFHARDLHLVLGPSADGKPVRFRVTLDGKPPGADHGLDVDANGMGVITGQRLYQLVRQHQVSKDPKADRRFQIEFLDPGAHVYAFTFG
jgi:hypothetical protein